MMMGRRRSIRERNLERIFIQGALESPKLKRQVDFPAFSKFGYVPDGRERKLEEISPKLAEEVARITARVRAGGPLFEDGNGSTARH